jgi:iron only hydrogenase large subunit-like protein
MESTQPVFTREAACQDCYRCLRECPVKAITVRNGMAAVDSDRCIYCGTCIGVCPAEAKTVRNDVPSVKLLLAEREKVVVSLAPSHAAAFPEGRLRAALLLLGFHAVEETALGAYVVSRALADRIKGDFAAGTLPPLTISTACTAVVTLVRKHFPHLVPCLSPLCSPAAAHGRLLREKYGDGAAIVFFGPCPAKKLELRETGCDLDAVLTFADLRNWLDDAHLSPDEIPGDSGAPCAPLPAAHGALYPIEGGMIESIRSFGPLPPLEMHTVSGLDAIIATLGDLDPASLRTPVFLELLACRSGCIGGACMPRSGRLLTKRSEIRTYADGLRGFVPPPDKVDLSLTYKTLPFADETFPAPEMRRALEMIGKHLPEDEINCGGCGYVTCRTFAQAMLQHRAEPAMCVSYMRSLAMKKANAMMQSMPAGAVIVDRELRIIECNLRFVQIAAPELEEHYLETKSLSEMSIMRIGVLDKYFSAVLATNQGIPEKQVRMGNRIVSISVFPIEPSRLAGGIVQDITQPAVRKERIISKAREVSRRQLTMVQQIASLLGENAADSETLLSEIIASFSVGEARKKPHDG